MKGARMSVGRRFGILIGLLVLILWVPVLATGLRSLRSRDRLGRSDALITTGVYRYVRHPLYAGLSFSVVGVGLTLGSRLLIAGGAVWLFVTWVWSVGEERDLMRRFGSAYEVYRSSTPRTVPHITRLCADLRRGGAVGG